MTTLLILLWLQSSPPPIALTGIVVDSSGAPVPGAAVGLEFTDGASRITSSASDGRFEFVNLPAGRARLIVSAPGFATIAQSLVLRCADTASPIRIVLEPAAQFETVTVTASRGEITGLSS